MTQTSNTPALNDQRRVRMGMVGGGSDAFIGQVHRMAARLDNQIELVCGAFSSLPEKSRQSGLELNLPADRCYSDYQTMMSAEANFPEHQRMDFVAIVTPNHLHFPIAALALEKGFHVLSEKPATLNLAQAKDLKNILTQMDKLYGLTHTYTGYPLVKQARHLIASGRLGKIRKIIVEYTQGWLASKSDETGKQASWRLDPAQSGSSCCIADIGVHAANLVEYLSGLTISRLCADLNRVVDGRLLDDDGTVMLEFENGAKGVLLASQIAVGDENNLRVRIYGDKASIDWQQLEPNNLWLKSNTQPSQLIRSGVGEFCHAAQFAMRTPAGHPQGYIEAFANIYRNFSRQILAKAKGLPASNEDFDVPGIQEAIRGMAFIEAVVAASQSEIKWHPLSASFTE